MKYLTRITFLAAILLLPFCIYADSTGFSKDQAEIASPQFIKGDKLAIVLNKAVAISSLGRGVPAQFKIKPQVDKQIEGTIFADAYGSPCNNRILFQLRAIRFTSEGINSSCVALDGWVVGSDGVGGIAAHTNSMLQEVERKKLCFDHDSQKDGYDKRLLLSFDTLEVAAGTEAYALLIDGLQSINNDNKNLQSVICEVRD